MKPNPTALLFLLAVLLGSANAALAEPALPDEAMSVRVMGDADAKVTIIEYASLTCPHCAKFHKETLPTLKAEYIGTGKAKLIYRDVPLDQYALKASLRARCPPAGRFFAFLDVLFSEQERWSRSEDPVAALVRIEQLGGVSKETFDACTSSEELTKFVLGQRLKGQQEHSVDSTPTFIVDGKKLVGAQPIAEFKAEIDGFLE